MSHTLRHTEYTKVRHKPRPQNPKTGHIEGMQSSGDQMFNGTAITKPMFKYINAKTRHLKNGTIFPFESSTSLYPEVMNCYLSP
jgi:hypothetical protein